MIGKRVNQEQKHLFSANLEEFINPKHELCLLAEKIDWELFEREFARLYSETGAPAKPVRLMVGLLILKQIYNLGDETVMEEWIRDPYFQYFCGEAVFQWKFPCDPSDLVHFRKRIGESGVEKILGQSILIHGEEVLKEDISIDTRGAGKEHNLSDRHKTGEEDYQEMPEDRLERGDQIEIELQADADEWMKHYNTERPHSGKYCYGKTPMETFEASKYLAHEKELDNKKWWSHGSTNLTTTTDSNNLSVR